ncbi:tyrosine-type recombinase/integrase [Candidatus Berkelbacteria bacterium]|nr:tyrosine-type recombinase/integrase [Candidatus Berkelbacteria bacterium]
MKLAEAVRRFLEDCELAQGLSRRTIENYQHYLGRFAEFAGELAVGAIDDELVRRWRLDLARRELSRATQNYHLVALRAFLAYLAKKNVASFPPTKVDLPGAEETEVTFLDAETIAQLLKTPNVRRRAGKRDRAILETLFSTGLRVAELASLDRKDVEGKEEVGVVGKGRKRRVVFLSPAAQQAIVDYMAVRTDDDEALFVREWRGEQKGGRLTTRSIQRLMVKYAEAAGVAEHVTPHTLRHTFATDLLQSGADLRAVQALLGHSSVVTTQRYTHLTDQHLRDVHQAFHGRRRTGRKQRDDRHDA